MRFRFDPTAEQRAALRAQLARLQQPAAVLEVLREVVRPDFHPDGVVCTVASVHSDRFVVRARVRSSTGEERGYALKVYSDDFGLNVWTYAQALAAHDHPGHVGLRLPSRYIPRERMLVFPWLDGQFLSEIVDDRKPDLLRRAALVAAGLHRLAIAPESLTTAQMIVDETRSRCHLLCAGWPEIARLLEPLMARLQEASSFLEPAAPAPVHGDLAAGQFLWTGEQLVLLDLDMFGYADPAYDAGHFLAQLTRRCLCDSTVPAQAAQWFACFRDAYLAAMPRVSPRNVSFYHGLTLVRKAYSVWRREPVHGPTLALQLVAAAESALQEMASPEYTQ